MQKSKLGLENEMDSMFHIQPMMMISLLVVTQSWCLKPVEKLSYNIASEALWKLAVKQHFLVVSALYKN